MGKLSRASQFRAFRPFEFAAAPLKLGLHSVGAHGRAALDDVVAAHSEHRMNVLRLAEEHQRERLIGRFDCEQAAGGNGSGHCLHILKRDDG